MRFEADRLEADRLEADRLEMDRLGVDTNPAIHTSPAAGTRYSGNECRIDVDPEYFINLAEAAGLRLAETLGSLCGQDTFLFKAR